MAISETVYVKRTLPKNFRQEDFHKFSKEFEKTFDRYKIIPLKKKFVSPRGIIIPSFNPFGLYKFLKKAKQNLFYHFKFKKSFLDKNSQYLIAFNHWSMGYFHWLTDTLTRIIVLQDEIENFNLILPIGCDQEFHFSSLEALNCRKITYIKSDEILYFHHALYVTPTAPTGNYDPEVISKLVDRLNKHYAKKNPCLDLGKRIFVSRKRASRRQLSNEEVIMVILKKFDFRVISFEDYSLEEQWSICQNANYMVGVHGAGLTNMLLMPNNSKVLEIKNSNDTQNLCYFSLASLLGFDYYYLFANPIVKEEAFHTANLIVDPVRFEEAIKTMLTDEPFKDQHNNSHPQSR